MPEQIKTVEDLVASESFQNWVNRTNPDDMAYWERWINDHPGHLLQVEEAVVMIRLMQSLKKKEVAHRKKDLIIEDLQNRLMAFSIDPKRHRIFTSRQLAAAASVLAVVSIAAYFLFAGHSHSRLRTDYGENKRINLPDGSQVNLNANTDLTVSKTWNATSAREVWLDGEAFFSIRHTQSNQRFIVHTDNGDIEVLGTEFNVYDRRGKTQVVLTSGKVKVIARNASDTIYLEPGQMLEFNSTYVSAKKQVPASRITSWRHNTLYFDNTSLLDIAIHIKDHFGYEVVWSDEEIKNMRFTYQLVGNDLDLLLTTLSEALDLEIRKKDNLIYIGLK